MILVLWKTYKKDIILQKQTLTQIKLRLITDITKEYIMLANKLKVQSKFKNLINYIFVENCLAKINRNFFFFFWE